MELTGHLTGLKGSGECWTNSFWDGNLAAFTFVATLSSARRRNGGRSSGERNTAPRRSGTDDTADDFPGYYGHWHHAAGRATGAKACTGSIYGLLFEKQNDRAG